MRLLLIVVLCCAVPAATAPKKRPQAEKTAGAPRKPGPDLPSKAPAGAPFCLVNGEAIPVSLYIDRMSLSFAPQMREMLIGEMLLRQEARRRKLSATRTEIEARVTRAYADMVRRVGDAKKLAEELERSRGWTPADYRAVIRGQADVQVLREKLAADLVKPADISQEEIEKRYHDQQQAFTRPEQVRISHILIRRPADGAVEKEEAARARAEGLLKKVREAGGANFEQVARESSEDAVTARRGGKLLIDLARGAHPFGAAFEAAVFSAPPGLINQVVAAPDGYHIIRLDEKKEGGLLPLSEVTEQIRSALLFERRQQAMDELFVRLRTRAEIKRTGKY